MGRAQTKAKLSSFLSSRSVDFIQQTTSKQLSNWTQYWRVFVEFESQAGYKQANEQTTFSNNSELVGDAEESRVELAKERVTICASFYYLLSTCNAAKTNNNNCNGLSSPIASAWLGFALLRSAPSRAEARFHWQGRVVVVVTLAGS